MAKKRHDVEAKPDEKLIRACVRYAQAVAGSANGYEVDPDGNFETAAEMAEPLWDRARDAMDRICNTAAITSDGLVAKACVAPMIFRGDEILCPSGFGPEFVVSFAADVKAYLKERAAAEKAAAAKPKAA